LATEPSAQRGYRAACPNCGAPVEFRSAASAFAVCSFCRSTIVRDGAALRRIGQSAELFDDHTPLQLGAAGRFQGEAFTLVGRLQYGYAEGTWNEWHALFDNGRSGWLSEDNGRYVFAFDAPLDAAAPAADGLRPGQSLVVAGQSWSVASITTAKLIAAQGELPSTPNLERGFAVADLRSTRGEVGTLDYTEPAAPKWSVGRSIGLSELAMTGLAAASEKTLKARGVECPSCGTALTVKLSTTQSIVCHQCHAVVDVSQGVGGDLKHYAQENGSEPQIPLGSTGTLAILGKGPLPWQVVGYAERCEVAQSADDDQVFWREYLLYHRQEGFAFLVDAEDGWSWTAPITGVPERAGEAVKHQGVLYRKLYDYTGRATYVLGEFYWKLERDALTYNTDYQGTGSFSARRLNRERTGTGTTQEITWSAGETLAADAVLKAFRLETDKLAALKRDALPTSGNAASLLAKLFFWGFVAVVVLMLFKCDGDDCSQLRSSYGEASAEYQNCLRNSSGGGFRTGGGSFGGYSSGGGHK
jgi:ribosomal protein L37AE/L43A